MLPLPPPVVRLPSCVLRPFHAADLEPMYAVASDPAIGRFMRDSFPVPYTRDDVLAWLRVCRTPGLPGSGSGSDSDADANIVSDSDSTDADSDIDAAPDLHLAICLHDGTFAGGIGLRQISADGTDRHTREIGYWIARPLWGRGLATEAAAGFARWALAPPAAALTHPTTRGLFADGPLRRVEAGVFADNTPSMRVLARAGFVREGVRRQAIIKRGELSDVVLFGLVPSDLETAAA